MKRLLLFSTLILLGTMLGAQSRWAFGLDVEGGVSGSKEVSDDNYSNPPFGTYSYRVSVLRRPGMSGGIWGEYLLSHRFGLRLGMNYTKLTAFSETKNISYSGGGVTSYSHNRFNMQHHQLRIPLETKLYFGPSDRRLRTFISAGVQASYLLSQMVVTNNYYGGSGLPEVHDHTYATEVDLNNEYLDIRRWQMSLITGVGLTGDRFTLSLQRTWGTKLEMDDFYLGGFCDCALCDCAYPSYGYGSRGAKQLQLTSLRFAYRLF